MLKQFVAHIVNHSASKFETCVLEDERKRFWNIKSLDIISREIVALLAQDTDTNLKIQVNYYAMDISFSQLKGRM